MFMLELATVKNDHTLRVTGYDSAIRPSRVFFRLVRTYSRVARTKRNDLQMMAEYADWRCVFGSVWMVHWSDISGMDLSSMEASWNFIETSFAIVIRGTRKRLSSSPCSIRMAIHQLMHTACCLVWRSVRWIKLPNGAALYQETERPAFGTHFS